MTTSGGDRQPVGPHAALEEMTIADVSSAANQREFTSDARCGFGPPNPVIRP
jgi:hypothetical protein